MKDLIEFLSEMDRSANTIHLWKTLNGYLLSCGVRQIFYRHTPLITGESFQNKHLYTDNLPKSVSERYIAERYFESDILQKMVSMQSQAYNWFDDEMLKAAKNSQTAFLNMLLEYMGNEVLILPVYGSSNRSGYFCLNFNGPRTDIAESALRYSQIACNYTHIKYSQYLTDKEISVVSLSPREMQIVRWVAKGKSNSAIGDIMGISRHTVDSYLRRIFIKMEATDRTTAALKALDLGLIIS